MPDISYDPFRDGAAITAAEMQARFTALQGQLAALPNYALADKALRKEHLPSLIAIDPLLTMGDYSKVNTALTPNFTNTYPGFATSLYAGTGPGAGAGWRGVHTLAQILFTGHQLGMVGSQRVQGYKLIANIELNKLYVETFADSDNWTACFCWMYRAGGAWLVVPKTERVVTQLNDFGRRASGFQRMDIPLRSTLLSADVGGAIIDGLQVAVAFYSQGVVPPAPGHVELAKWSIMALPFHAGA